MSLSGLTLEVALWGTGGIGVGEKNETRLCKPLLPSPAMAELAPPSRRNLAPESPASVYILGPEIDRSENVTIACFAYEVTKDG